jgi:glycosidase
VPYWRQKEDANSLLNFYRRLIGFRNATPALTYGDIEESGIYIEEVVSFKRRYQNEEILVLHNISDVEVTFAVDEPASFSRNLFNTAGDELKINEGSLVVPAYTTAIFAKE